jgi:hypothetical protein
MNAKVAVIAERLCHGSSDAASSSSTPRGPALGLLRHGPYRAGADLMRILIEQPLDLVDVHAREVPGGREHRAHPDADELVVALREVPPLLQALGLGRLALEPRTEGVGGGVGPVAERVERPA